MSEPVKWKPKANPTIQNIAAFMLDWNGYTYRDEESRDAHCAHWQTGAVVKLTYETGWLFKRYHLLVGMPA